MYIKLQKLPLWRRPFAAPVSAGQSVLAPQWPAPPAPLAPPGALTNNGRPPYPDRLPARPRPATRRVPSPLPEDLP